MDQMFPWLFHLHQASTHKPLHSGIPQMSWTTEKLLEDILKLPLLLVETGSSQVWMRTHWLGLFWKTPLWFLLYKAASRFVWQLSSLWSASVTRGKICPLLLTLCMSAVQMPPCEIFTPGPSYWRKAILRTRDISSIPDEENRSIHWKCSLAQCMAHCATEILFLGFVVTYFFFFLDAKWGIRQSW